MSDIIFTTPHGSHLYGLAHAGSDNDSMIVYNSNMSAKSSKVGVEDVLRVGIYDLLEKAQGGAHQYVEGIMSQQKVYEDESWRPYIEGLQLPPALIGEKFERTIKKLCFSEEMKLRRHALRLWLYLDDMRMLGTGRFNPTLPEVQANFITNIAETWEGQDLKNLLLST